MKIRFFLKLLIACVLFCYLIDADEFDALKESCSDALQIPMEKLLVERIVAGVSNQVYLIKTELEPKYVAKVFSEKSLSELKEIEKTLSVLRGLGFNVPRAVWIGLTKESTPLLISEFVEGEFLNQTNLERAAKLMGELHIQCSAKVSIIEKSTKTDEHYRILFEKCAHWPHAKKLKEIYENLDLSYLSLIPRGVIHGDFSFTNLITRKNGSLYLIDFEHICSSYLLTDLARCQMFYGFDPEGNLIEELVENFVSEYSSVRSLTNEEIENFYTHMKLVMIDTALEMYNRLYVSGSLSEDIVQNQNNATLLPDLLAKKIFHLEAKKEISFEKLFEQRAKPILFFGLSGVGKTTIIKKLAAEKPSLFYIPIFTCTRAPRSDDEKAQFEYISKKEFVRLEEQGVFLFSMHEGDRFYGYRKRNLLDKKKHPLLNCSAYALSNISHLKALTVLIEGNANMGLLVRNNTEDYEKRILNNKHLQAEFYTQPWFLKKIDILHFNQWSMLRESVESLFKKIEQELESFQDDFRADRAA